MAQFGDFLARLVSAGGTRGLSGDADRVLPAEPVFAYFNDRLRKHHTAEDFVSDPGLLWSTQTFLARKGGLEAHLRAERADGVAGFSDMLVIINADDRRRSLRQLSEPWAGQAAYLLGQRFRTFCDANDFHRLFPQRPMGVRVVEDGGLSMGGESLGLARGEFVTGLLPNFYGGAQATSRPIVGFHLNIPGAWTGYREVGRLYSDQVLFTLGSHWLDNYRHPRLQLPALYRLQQFADGSFIHIVNPEAMPDLQIVEQQSNGATVITLQHVSGVALAHIVLAMLDGDSSIGGGTVGPWSAPPSDDDIDLPVEEDSTSSIAPAVPDAFGQSRTVVPAEVDAKLLTLRERGVLLQRVHFARFMTGYDVFVGPAGEVGTALEAPSATLQVRKRRVSVVAHVPGVTLDGGPLPPGRPIVLQGEQRLAVEGTELHLRDLSNVDLPHWPYLLEIRRPGGSSHLVFGRTHRFGRDPRCSVRLPDEPHNGNIVWRPEVQNSRVIRSRNGEIPKSRFYIDSIMVASEHAELDLDGEPRLRGRARDCYSYVRRGDEILAISPTRRPAGRRELGLQPRDELLIGNSVFQVGWAHDHLSIEPLTAEVLAAAVDELVTEDRPPMPNVARTPALSDAPAAGGLGERGPAPPRFAPPSPPTADSLLEEDVPPVQAAPPMMALSEPPAEPPPRRGPPPRRVGPPMVVSETDGPPPLVGPPMIPGDTADVQPVIGPPMIPGDTADVQPVVGPPMIPGDTAAVQPVDPPSMLDEATTTPPAAPPPPVEVTSELTDVVARPPEIPLEAPPPAAADSIEDAPALVIPESAPTVQAHDDFATARPESLPPEPAFIHKSPPPVRLRPPPPPKPAPVASQAPAPDDLTEAAPHDVVVVDEEAWQLELGRPARLVTTGWMVAGKVTVGNHTGCEVVLPENRVEPDQSFAPVELARIKVRGNRGHVRTTGAAGAELTQDGQPTQEATDLSTARLEVVRCDADGDEDFRIVLTLVVDNGLPDPRARRLAIDRSDPMVAGLFTLGLPLRTARRVRLGPVVANATWTGEAVVLSDYLSTYQKADGSFHPLFTRHGAERFITAPEDGGDIQLNVGDVILAGGTWIEVAAHR